MPIGEPPAEDVAELNELIRAAEHELHEATDALGRINDLIARAEFVPATAGEQMRRRVMVRVRGEAVNAWSQELDTLHRRARSLGLQP